MAASDVLQIKEAFNIDTIMASLKSLGKLLCFKDMLKGLNYAGAACWANSINVVR